MKYIIIIGSILVFFICSSNWWFVQSGNNFELHDYRIVYTLDGSATSDYNFTSEGIDINPTDDTIVHIFVRNDSHFSVGERAKFMIRKGASLSNLNEPDTIEWCRTDTFSYVNGACGFSGNRLCFLYQTNTAHDQTFYNMYYRYSDDNGITWSDSVIVDTTGLNIYGIWPMTHNPITLSNGDILFASYSVENPYPTFGNFTNYVHRSTDGGLTFDSINVVGISALQLSEPTIVNICDSVVVLFGRNLLGESAAYYQYRSTDYGVTWSYDGTTDFNENIGVGSQATHSGFLQEFKINNISLVANYIFQRTAPKRYYVIYALSSDLAENGLTAWNLSTKRTLDADFNQSAALHGYPTVFHPYNDLRGYGVVTNETASDNYTEIKYYETPTIHLPDLINIFGL